MAQNHPHILLTGHPGVGKTTIIKAVQSAIHNNCSNVTTKGFYTEECRSNSGDRIGFDIVSWCSNPSTPSTPYNPSNPSSHQDHATQMLDEFDSREVRRNSLSRIMNRIKRTDPHVGNYLVNVENVEKYAVGSISSNDVNEGQRRDHELIIIDEIGKMEMLCPQFLPAVNQILDSTNQETTSSNHQRIILGTIPTPRYGRVIQAVEDVRAREDVLTLHVTKANRDEMKDMLQVQIQNILGTKAATVNLHEIFAPFIYTRPIGASSMSNNNTNKSKVISSAVSKKEQSITNPSTTSKPCGVLKIENILPKVLILGQTSSPLPSNVSYAYHERSMWMIFGAIFQIDYKPIKDIKTAHEDEIQMYLTLKEKVLSKGICIWDLFSDIHETLHRGTTRTTNKKRKRQKQEEGKPNDIDSFLKDNSSIEMIAFIGQKAHDKYKIMCLSSMNSKIELVILPSSSPANTRLSKEEKGSVWKDSISKCIPNLVK